MENCTGKTKSVSQSGQVPVAEQTLRWVLTRLGTGSPPSAALLSAALFLGLGVRIPWLGVKGTAKSQWEKLEQGGGIIVLRSNTVTSHLYSSPTMIQDPEHIYSV